LRRNAIARQVADEIAVQQDDIHEKMNVMCSDGTKAVEKKCQLERDLKHCDSAAVQMLSH